MKITITVRIAAETKDEAMKALPEHYRALREHVEGLVVQGVLPTEADVRWLLVPRRWE